MPTPDEQDKAGIVAPPPLIYLAILVFGLLLVTGVWTEMMLWLQGWLAANGLAESVL